MARRWAVSLALALMLSTYGIAAAAESEFRGLSLATPFPSQTVRVGEPVTLVLTVKNFKLPPQVVTLRVTVVPRGWEASLLGAGRGVEAVYVAPDQETTVTLRLQPPAKARAGTYQFRVVAQGQGASAELPITLKLGHVLPRRLSLEPELPVLRGTPTTTFRYRLTLKNESDQDLLVNLDAAAPRGFQVSFSLIGQQVSSIPLKAGESRDVDAEVSPPSRPEAGTYPITVRAIGGDARAEVKLTLEIVGRPELSLRTPEERLSARAYAGRRQPIKLIIKNTGSAPARGVTLSASEPSGWEVGFDPERIEEIAANGVIEVTAAVTPSAKALTGDYMLTISANASDVSTSADFRITVATSTLWGLVGLLLVAAALGVLTLAVNRYGRR